MRLAVVLSILIAMSGSARADEREERDERARRELEEGVRLFKIGDFEGARTLFMRADATRHSAPIVFNLARAEEKLGHVQAALDAYDAYLLEAGSGTELGVAALVAIAEIRERSARIKVESEPPGALVEIDGYVLRTRAPVTAWVRPGTNRVRVTAAGIDEQRVVQDTRPGEERVERFVAPVAAREEEEFRWFGGGAVALIPYHFIGAPKSPTATRFADHTNVTLGLSVEGGVRMLPHFYLSMDLFGAVGTYGHPNYVVGGGLGVLYHFDLGLWIRGAATIGAVDSNKLGKVLSTDVVLGPSIEIGYEFARRRSGAWFVSAAGCYLPADALRDNDAMFFPLRLGFRAM